MLCTVGRQTITCCCCTHDRARASLRIEVPAHAIVCQDMCVDTKDCNQPVPGASFLTTVSNALCICIWSTHSTRCQPCTEQISPRWCVHALQKFAESLLEVADNLESAARAVPGGVLQEGAEVPAQTALKYLKALLEGVQATERVLLKVGTVHIMCSSAVCFALCECA